MYQILDKDTIKMEIIPYLPKDKRGPSPSVPLAEIVNCILYKLKTGIQWKLLPVDSLFSQEILHYKTVSGWKGFNFLAFIVLGIKKFIKNKNSG